MKVVYSSELMKNQKHATVMGPHDQFSALQTQQSHVLFFSIGPDKVFYRTLEQPGTKAGWLRLDESNSLQPMFGNSSVAAKLFAVAQNLFEGTFDVAMAITISGADHLVLSLGNANLDRSWETPLPWISIPFDNPSGARSNLKITGIYLLQDRQSNYVVVDVLDDPTSPLRLIKRYVVDPSKLRTGLHWNKHELAYSLQADGVSSLIGRKGGQIVDGVYTLGNLAGGVELNYSQIYNPFNPTHGNPLVTRFKLPAGSVASDTAFALGKNPNGTTDLYVAAAGGLYFLAAGAQHDLAEPALIAEHHLLRGVIALGVNVSDTEIVVWGLNKFGRVFCLRNKPASQSDPAAWSQPVPLMANALRLASLINRSAGGSTIFAHTSDDVLVQLTESPVTRLWARRSIVLPPTSPKDMLTVKSYTTHVQLTGDDNLPLQAQAVAMTSVSPCNVYINGRYTQLFVDAQVLVKTDERGTLTIIQEVTSLGAVAYRIDAGGNSTVVDPMTKVMTKLSHVKSGSDFDVEVTNSRGQRHPLLGAGITAQQKEDSAKAIADFVGVGAGLPPDGSTARGVTTHGKTPRVFELGRDRIFGLAFSGGPRAYFNTVEGAVAAGVSSRGGLESQGVFFDASLLEDAIWALAGDVYEWISHAVDDVEEFFLTVVDNVATCFVKIAGKLYRFLVDCVQSVANGISFILQKIKVLMEDLIEWLGFLFAWPDILRTHRVLRNLFKQVAVFSVNELGTIKQEIHNAFATIEKDIKGWANLPVMPGSQSSIAGSSSTPSGSTDPQVHWGTYQMTENAENSQTGYTQPIPESSPLKNLLSEMVSAFQREEQVFVNAFTQLKTDVIAQFTRLSTTQILEKVVAILLDVFLETIENLIDTAIDIVQILVEGVIDFLDAPIDIPVISQIYREATDGDPLTILDAACLVAAIPTTILYKIAEEEAPFPDDSFTERLIYAPDLAAIRRLYFPPASSSAITNAFTTLQKVCLIASVPGTVVWSMTGLLRTKLPNNLPNAIIGAVSYLPFVAPNLPAMLQDDSDEIYNAINSYCTSISIAKTFVDISLTKYIKGGINGSNLIMWNDCSPYFEAIINILWFAPVIHSVVEDHSDLGVLECIANSGFNIGGIMSMLTSFSDPDSIAAGLFGFLAGNSCYGTFNMLQLQLENHSTKSQF